MKSITDRELTALVDEAKLSTRLRKNLNLHPQLNDPIQRLCNAFEPGSYVRPHRHPEADRWELFVILKGEAVVLVFDASGKVIERVCLSSQGPNHIVEIPPQSWHTVYATRSGTVLFEIKQGPYNPLTDKDFAGWAPEENTIQAAELTRWFEQAQVGDIPPELSS